MQERKRFPLNTDAGQGAQIASRQKREGANDSLAKFRIRKTLRSLEGKNARGVGKGTARKGSSKWKHPMPAGRQGKEEGEEKGRFACHRIPIEGAFFRGVVKKEVYIFGKSFWKRRDGQNPNSARRIPDKKKFVFVLRKRHVRIPGEASGSRVV